MAANFDIGGDQGFIFRRVLNASDEWVPAPVASDIIVTDGAGVLDTTLTGLANGISTGNGFFMMPHVSVTVCFNGKGSSSCEIQVYNPVDLGSGAFDVGWQTWIPNADIVSGRALRLEGQFLAWRAGCVTFDAGDTSLNVTVVFQADHP